MNVVVIGLGYVGLTTAVALAYLKNNVVGIDIDSKKINELNQKRSPIYEPHLDVLLKKLDIIYMSEYDKHVIQNADVIFITVGTPPLPDGKPDLRFVKEAVINIGKNISHKSNTLIVNKSTVPVGTAHWVKNLIKRQLKTPNNVSVVSNPEFLREGTALYDTFYPDRIVVGADNSAAIQILYDLYSPIIKQNFDPPPELPRPQNVEQVPFLAMDTTSAELTKYAANSFLALKISFINEIALLAEKVGGNITLIANAIGLDKRIGGQFLKAGVGWGGSCFGKDTAALIEIAKMYDSNLAIVEAARNVNYSQRRFVVSKLISKLQLLRGREIGILGLTFKPNTDDLRDSPALSIINELLKYGVYVKVHDPIALRKLPHELASEVCLCERIEDLAKDSDAILLITDWPQYRQLDWKRIYKLMNNPYILDSRNFLDCKKLTDIGFKYEGIGKRCVTYS